MEGAVQEMTAGWFTDVLLVLDKIFESPAIKALFETLGEVARSTEFCGGKEHSLEKCTAMMHQYAPYSFIVVPALVVICYVCKLDSHQH
jgi:hypothetical protein